MASDASVGIALSAAGTAINITERTCSTCIRLISRNSTIAEPICIKGQPIATEYALIRVASTALDATFDIALRALAIFIELVALLFACAERIPNQVESGVAFKADCRVLRRARAAAIDGAQGALPKLIDFLVLIFANTDARTILHKLL